MKYYNGARTHLSLEKDAPVSRAVDRAGHIFLSPNLGRTASPICPDLIYDRHIWDKSFAPTGTGRGAKASIARIANYNPNPRTSLIESIGFPNRRRPESNFPYRRRLRFHEPN
jgi:hypothetical protein